MAKLKNIHPGEVLSEEFVTPLNIPAYKLAKDIDIRQTTISQIIKGNRRITADTALRLSKYFGTPQSFGLDCRMILTSKRRLLLRVPF